QEIALSAASRAAIPIVVSRLQPVVGPRDGFRVKDLLLNRVADEVLNELEVIGSVRIHARLAVATAVPEIRARRDIAGVHGAEHRAIDGRNAGASSSTEALRPTIPRALDFSRPAVRGTERQGQDDVDVLIRIGAVE